MASLGDRVASQIVDHRIDDASSSSASAGGFVQYKVRWAGAGEDDDEWFDREDLVTGDSSTALLVANYERQRRAPAKDSEEQAALVKSRAAAISPVKPHRPAGQHDALERTGSPRAGVFSLNDSHIGVRGGSIVHSVSESALGAPSRPYGPGKPTYDAARGTDAALADGASPSRYGARSATPTRPGSAGHPNAPSDVAYARTHAQARARVRHHRHAPHHYQHLSSSRVNDGPTAAPSAWPLSGTGSAVAADTDVGASLVMGGGVAEGRYQADELTLLKRAFSRHMGGVGALSPSAASGAGRSVVSASSVLVMLQTDGSVDKFYRLCEGRRGVTHARRVVMAHAFRTLRARPVAPGPIGAGPVAADTAAAALDTVTWAEFLDVCSSALDSNARVHRPVPPPPLDEKSARQEATRAALAASFNKAAAGASDYWVGKPLSAEAMREAELRTGIATSDGVLPAKHPTRLTAARDRTREVLLAAVKTVHRSVRSGASAAPASITGRASLQLPSLGLSSDEACTAMLDACEDLPIISELEAEAREKQREADAGEGGTGTDTTTQARVRQHAVLEALATVGQPFGHHAPLARVLELSLHDNHLTSVPEPVIWMASLKSLDLSSNRIEFLPRGIGDLKDLVSLNLSRNALYHLPPTIAKPPNLRALSVSHNRLTSLPLALSEAMALEHVDAGNNAGMNPTVAAAAASPGVLMLLALLRAAATVMDVDVWATADAGIDSTYGKYPAQGPEFPAAPGATGSLNAAAARAAGADPTRTGVAAAAVPGADTDALKPLAATKLELAKTVSWLPSIRVAFPRSVAEMRQALAEHRVSRASSTRHLDLSWMHTRGDAAAQPGSDTPYPYSHFMGMPEVGEATLSSVVIATVMARLAGGGGGPLITSVGVDGASRASVAHGGISSLLLTGNALGSMPSSILVHQPHLRILNLSRCSLNSLPGHVVAHFPNLVDLDVSDNKLTRLPPSMAVMQRLRKLDISHNRFATLDSVVAGLVSLEVLAADDNPWSDKTTLRIIEQCCKLSSQVTGATSFIARAPGDAGNDVARARAAAASVAAHSRAQSEAGVGASVLSALTQEQVDAMNRSLGPSVSRPGSGRLSRAPSDRSIPLSVGAASDEGSDGDGPHKRVRPAPAEGTPAEGSALPDKDAPPRAVSAPAEAARYSRPPPLEGIPEVDHADSPASKATGLPGGGAPPQIEADESAGWDVDVSIYNSIGGRAVPSPTKGGTSSLEASGRQHPWDALEGVTPAPDRLQSAPGGDVAASKAHAEGLPAQPARAATAAVGAKKTSRRFRVRKTPWILYTDEDGDTYFYNNETGESEWELPEQFVAKADGSVVEVLGELDSEGSARQGIEAPGAPVGKLADNPDYVESQNGTGDVDNHSGVDGAAADSDTQGHTAATARARAASAPVATSQRAVIEKVAPSAAGAGDLEQGGERGAVDLGLGIVADANVAQNMREIRDKAEAQGDVPVHGGYPDGESAYTNTSYSRSVAAGTDAPRPMANVEGYDASRVQVAETAVVAQMASEPSTQLVMHVEPLPFERCTFVGVTLELLQEALVSAAPTHQAEVDVRVAKVQSLLGAASAATAGRSATSTAAMGDVSSEKASEYRVAHADASVVSAHGVPTDRPSAAASATTATAAGRQAPIKGPAPDRSYASASFDSSESDGKSANTFGGLSASRSDTGSQRDRAATAHNATGRAQRANAQAVSRATRSAAGRVVDAASAVESKHDQTGGAPADSDGNVGRAHDSAESDGSDRDRFGDEGSGWVSDADFPDQAPLDPDNGVGLDPTDNKEKAKKAKKHKKKAKKHKKHKLKHGDDEPNSARGGVSESESEAEGGGGDAGGGGAMQSVRSADEAAASVDTKGGALAEAIAKANATAADARAATQAEDIDAQDGQVVEEPLGAGATALVGLKQVDSSVAPSYRRQRYGSAVDAWADFTPEEQERLLEAVDAAADAAELAGHAPRSALSGTASQALDDGHSATKPALAGGSAAVASRRASLAGLSPDQRAAAFSEVHGKAPDDAGRIVKRRALGPATVVMPDGEVRVDGVRVAEDRVQWAASARRRGLDLRSLGLTTVPALPALPSLVELDLSRNNLTELPLALASCLALRRLDVSYNAITDGGLPATLFFERLARLVSLNLSHCELTEVPESVLALTGIRVLDVSHNKVNTLPTALTKMQRLESIAVQGNPLPEYLLAAAAKGVGSLWATLDFSEGV